MFEGIVAFFKKVLKPGQALDESSKDTAKERLHLVLMQDRANVSADFLDLMKQEIIEVIKKYIEVDEKEIDVRLTNKANDDGTNGAPALYANIPIINIKNDVKGEKMREQEKKDEPTDESKKKKKNTSKKENVNKKSKEENSEDEAVNKENIEDDNSQKVEDSKEENNVKNEVEDEVKNEVKNND